MIRRRLHAFSQQSDQQTGRDLPYLRFKTATDKDIPQHDVTEIVTFPGAMKKPAGPRKWEPRRQGYGIIQRRSPTEMKIGFE